MRGESTEAVIRLLSYVTCPTCGESGDSLCLIEGDQHGRRKPSMRKSHRARWDAAGNLYQSVKS